jgi:hypothetical protein
MSTEIERPDKPSRPTLRLTGIRTERSLEIKTNGPYRIEIDWESDFKEATYNITISYSSDSGSIPADHRARPIIPNKSDDEAIANPHIITNYKGTSLAIDDFKYDGAEGQNPRTKGDKVYTITIEYFNPKQHGVEKITWKIKKYWIPDTNPHSEGDVIRPPFGGG